MHYLQLGPVGGRGGTQRFFMLANGIPFEEKLFAVPGEWGDEKKRLIETGENPCGGVPVTYVDNVHMAQHVGTCRYLARTNKLDTGDNLKDYYQDMIADEYQGFRNLWVVKTFEASDVEKAEYKTKTLPTLLAKFDALYKKYKTADPYLSTSPDGKPVETTVIRCSSEPQGLRLFTPRSTGREDKKIFPRSKVKTAYSNLFRFA